MKFLIKTILVLLLIIPTASYAEDMSYSNTDNLLSLTINNLNSWFIKPEWKWAKNNDYLDSIQGSSNFIEVSAGWEKWINYVLIRWAKDMKNIFFILASIYLLVLILKLLFLDHTDEEVAKFKKGVLWTTIWIIIMQISYGFISILYDKDIWERLAYNLIDNIVNPLIALVETAASFFFLAVAIYAFYRLVTSDGDEEKAKTWKKSIIYAVVWFIIIKFSKLIVEATYWKLNNDCVTSFSLIPKSCLYKAEIEWVSNIVITIINWINSFVGIVVLIMILYAWSLVLLSAWDEEKLKKAKSIILYVIIWMFLLATNYMILTFFLIPEAVI